MNNLSWKNFKKYFWNYLPALLILALGTSLINVVMKIQKRIDNQLKENVNGIETLVGAKGSPIQLVMANIYHLDDPTGNISLEKAMQVTQNPMVASAIPLAYGDNHKGYKLLGTNLDYINHFKGKLSEGKHVSKILEVVVGSKVASDLKIDLGYTFYSTHGSSEGHEHKENQYVVVGILEKSGTVLDNLLITSIGSFWKTHHQEDLSNPFDSLSFLQAEALNKNLPKTEEHHHSHDTEAHEHEHEHDHSKSDEHDHHHEAENHNHKEHHEHAEHTEDNDHHSHAEEHEEEHHHEEAPAEKQITALLLKFKGPAGFFIINQINSSPDMMAVNPSQTVLKFLSVLGIGYQTVTGIAYGVILVAIITLMLTLIQVFARRKYELALLRTMGASKFSLLTSLIVEVFILVFSGFLLGLALTYSCIELLPKLVDKNIFDSFDWSSIGKEELMLLLVCLICGMISVIIPLYKVYKIDISKTLSHE